MRAGIDRSCGSINRTLMQNKESLDLDYQQFKKIDDSCFLSFPIR